MLSVDPEEEIARVVGNKFGWSSDRIAEALTVSFANVFRVSIEGNVMGCRDADDDKVLDCAVTAGAEIIVSGDKDLLALDPFRAKRIITPAEHVALSMS